MKGFTIFFHLLVADLKRLRNYILPIFSSILILIAICSLAAKFVAGNIYKEGSSSIINIGYYLPDDDDFASNSFGINIVKDLEGTKEVASIIQVNNIEEGYDMLKNGEILYYIIVPENFFSGIMDSTNPELTILFGDTGDITSYITNELFSAYARYLGIAQAGVYSGIDTLVTHDTDKEERYAIQDMINMTFLDRSLNKDMYLEKQEATCEGNFSLIEHYMAVAVMLSLFFVSFVFMSYLQGYGGGLFLKLTTYGINNIHIFFANYLSTLPALYLAYLPCYVGMSLWKGSFNIKGLIYILPSLMIISLIINIIASLSKKQFAANISILIVTLLIAYIGGGIFPAAMLPDGIKDLSGFLPGEYLIGNIAASLFGL